MHIQKTSTSDTGVSLTIKADETDLQPIKKTILAKLAKDVKVPGYRDGKVPAEVVEKHIDASKFQTEFLDEALTVLYAQATQSEKIRPVTQPKVDIKKFVPHTQLEFEVSTEVVGKVKLGDYKSIKTEAQAKKVTEKDIEGVLNTLQTRMSQKKSVTRGAKDGDETVIDFKGKDEKGEVIKGSEGKDYPLILGSKTFIPGFEENLIGMKPADTKSFELTFPKDYGVKALANKKVTFEVRLNTVNELTKPKVDDELAKQVGPFQNVDELKADIKKQLEHEASGEALRNKQNQVVDELLKTCSAVIPQELIDKQAAFELDEFRRNLTYRGQTYDEFLEQEGTTDEKYQKEVIVPRAENQLKIGVYLSEIADKEGIGVSAEELEAQMNILREQYKDPGMQEQLNKPEARQDIASRILSQKVVNYIIDQSK